MMRRRGFFSARVPRPQWIVSLGQKWQKIWAYEPFTGQIMNSGDNNFLSQSVIFHLGNYGRHFDYGRKGGTKVGTKMVWGWWRGMGGNISEKLIERWKIDLKQYIINIIDIKTKQNLQLTDGHRAALLNTYLRCLGLVYFLSARRKSTQGRRIRSPQLDIYIGRTLICTKKTTPVTATLFLRVKQTPDVAGHIITRLSSFLFVLFFISFLRF